LLRFGAAGASGTVTEPYAIQNKFPTPFLHVFYASGCTLAEAFYQSVHGPYQLLIVGDPLCRPWAKIPRLEIQGVPIGATWKAHRLRIRPKIVSQQNAAPVKGTAAKIGRYEIYLDGHRLLAAPAAPELEIPTAGLCDGYHEVRVVAVMGGRIETQASVALPILMDRQSLSIEVSPPKSVAMDEAIEFHLRAPRARRIVVLQNYREVASVAGSEGLVTIPAARLGLGPVRLQPLAILRDIPGEIVLGERDRAKAILGKGEVELEPSDLYMGKPFEVTITPPKALSSLKDRPQELAPGLRLSSAGQSAVVERVSGGDWLAKTVKPGQDFVVDGYFNTPVEDMYQFQLRSSIEIKLVVDGRGVQAFGARLKYFPVSLAAGLHVVTLQGRAAGKATLELLFGGPGATTVDKYRFRHRK
jgi:hypothetical protein